MRGWLSVWSAMLACSLPWLSACTGCGGDACFHEDGGGPPDRPPPPDVPEADVEAEVEEEADVEDVVDAAGCCVSIAGTPTEILIYCQGPGILGGPQTPYPNVIVAVESGETFEYFTELRAGLDETVADHDALLLRGRGLGDEVSGIPAIQYWLGSGTHYRSDGSAGDMAITTWSGVGGRVVGTYSGHVVKDGTGDGPDTMDITGTFCAIREL